MTKQRKQVAFVVYPGINLLDLTGTFSAMRHLPLAGYESFTVAGSLETLISDTVLAIVPDKIFSEAPHPEWLVVMGGGISSLAALGNEALRSYVLQAGGSAELIIGVSTGALLLAGLGLLDGRKATTHSTYTGLLSRLGATHLPERQVEDGRFITCAGGTAGYELGLLMLARYASEKLARQQQIRYEYDAQPPFGRVEPGTDDETALSTLLARHQTMLKAALQSYPELYHRLYSTEPAAGHGQAASKGTG